MTSRHYPHRLTFRQPTESTNAAGQVVRTYSDSASRRAHVVSQPGTVSSNIDQKNTTAQRTITLPHDSAVDQLLPTQSQIVWRDTGETLVPFSVQTDRIGRNPITTILAMVKQ